MKQCVFKSTPYVYCGAWCWIRIIYSDNIITIVNRYASRHLSSNACALNNLHLFFLYRRSTLHTDTFISPSDCDYEKKELHIESFVSSGQSVGWRVKSYSFTYFQFSELIIGTVLFFGNEKYTLELQIVYYSSARIRFPLLFCFWKICII